MANTNIFIEFDELSRLQKDSADKANIIAILNTEFPDETCQLIAIKSILGIVETEEEPTEPSDPSDPGTTDPIDPPAGGDPDPTDPPTGDPGSDPTP